MNNTAINWTKLTWNPMSGCEKVSEGCKYCYAFSIAEPKRGTPAFPNGFDLTIRPHKLNEPYKVKEPSLIFVNSMSDLFWDKVPQDYRDKIVDVIEDTPQHQYQVLTKRPDIMLEYSKRRPLPSNFWAGVTIEGGRVFEDRINILRKVKADIHFISAEPLIAPLNDKPGQLIDLSGIEWVITGGESGIHLHQAQTCQRRGLVMKVFKQWVARPDRKYWIRDIRNSCEYFGVAFWHKQWGGPYPHSAGRLLDGRTHDGLPRVPGAKKETVQLSFDQMLA